MEHINVPSHGLKKCYLMMRRTLSVLSHVRAWLVAWDAESPCRWFLEKVGRHMQKIANMFCVTSARQSRNVRQIRLCDPTVRYANLEKPCLFHLVKIAILHLVKRPIQKRTMMATCGQMVTRPRWRCLYPTYRKTWILPKGIFELGAWTIWFWRSLTQSQYHIFLLDENTRPYWKTSEQRQHRVCSYWRQDTAVSASKDSR